MSSGGNFVFVGPATYGGGGGGGNPQIHYKFNGVASITGNPPIVSLNILNKTITTTLSGLHIVVQVLVSLINQPDNWNDFFQVLVDGAPVPSAAEGGTKFTTFRTNLPVEPDVNLVAARTLHYAAVASHPPGTFDIDVLYTAVAPATGPRLFTHASVQVIEGDLAQFDIIT